MSAFEFISVALSFVLGLGIARLLTAAVNVFRRRDEIEIHWMPLVWAVSIFMFQIQFWWTIFDLSDSVEQWTLLRFVSLLGMAMLLFVAGALVLPASGTGRHSNLLRDFEHDGRWALIFLLAYFTASLWVNWYFWGETPFDAVGAIVIALIVVLALFLSLSNHVARNVVTVLFLLLSIYACIALSPSAY